MCCSCLGPGATEGRTGFKQTPEIGVQTINRLRALGGFGKHGKIKVLSDGFFFSPRCNAFWTAGRIGTQC